MELTQPRANVLIVLGGCMWGVYWLPLRHLEGMGFTGASAGIALYTGCLLLLLPFTLGFGAVIRTQWRVLLFSSLLTGAAFSLFTTALALTDVIRAILLFYLTPAWGTILGLVFLGERLDRARILAVLFAFVGLAVILGGNEGIPIPRTTGDIFALLSGIFWAVGSMGFLKAPDIPARVQVFGFFLGALVLSLITLGVVQGQGGVPISVTWDPTVMGYVLIYTLYMIPMVFLTILPATVLPPARIGVLLMSEVAVGAVSAALLSGEAFGAHEALGTLLIIAAAMFEVLGKRDIRSA
jgi:drug/metabolite transporter (DMT)-like permease